MVPIARRHTWVAAVVTVLAVASCGRGGADPDARPSPEFDPGRRPCYDIDYDPVIQIYPFSRADITAERNDEDDVWTCTLVPTSELVGGQSAQLVVVIAVEEDAELAAQVYEGMRDSRGGFRALPPEDLADGWDRGGTWRQEIGNAGERLSTATVGSQLQDGVLLLVMTFGLSGFADADAQAEALLELAENVRTSLRD